jgi:hypothetical protein
METPLPVRYTLVTYIWRKILPSYREGNARGQFTPPTPLPQQLQLGVSAACSLRITDDVAQWAACGQLATCVLRFRLTECTERDQLRFALNSKVLPMGQPVMRQINQMYKMVMPRYRVFGQCEF